MKLLSNIFGWFLVLFFTLFLILCLITDNYRPAFYSVIAIFLSAPLTQTIMFSKFKKKIPVWLKIAFIPILLIASVFSIFKGMGNKESIYKNEAVKQQIHNIYDAKMQTWPVEYKSMFVESEYGKVHVLQSGADSLKPLVLLHASAMSSWSWKHNIEALSKEYKVYCIDMIGDAGRSELADINKFPKNEKLLNEFYKEVADSLKLSKFSLIGASQGGYAATLFAAEYPEMVNKLVLSGPMGFAGTSSSVFRILFISMFPIDAVKNSSVEWAFGSDPVVNSEVDEWFSTIITGVLSRQSRPKTIKPEILADVQAPVLLVLGQNDSLLGSPEEAKNTAKNLKDVNSVVLETGHLIALEKSKEFNKTVLDFLNNSVE